MGGYPVTINGVGLGNGSDITTVTLVGLPAYILSQSSDSVVVLATPTSAGGTGAVIVTSLSAGVTELADAFTYNNELTLGGKVAIGVIIPVLVGGLVVAFVCLCRRRGDGPQFAGARSGLGVSLLDSDTQL